MCNHAGVLTSSTLEPEPLLIPSAPVLCIAHTHFYSITQSLKPRTLKQGLSRQTDSLIGIVWISVWVSECVHGQGNISMSVLIQVLLCIISCEVYSWSVWLKIVKQFVEIRYAKLLFLFFLFFFSKAQYNMLFGNSSVGASVQLIYMLTYKNLTLHRLFRVVYHKLTSYRHQKHGKCGISCLHCLTSTYI